MSTENFIETVLQSIELYNKNANVYLKKVKQSHKESISLIINAIQYVLGSKSMKPLVKLNSLRVFLIKNIKAFLPL